MKYHPLSEYLPIMPGHELTELADSIREHGLREPITTFEGKILDGRNRFLACKRAGVKPRFREFDASDDALIFVITSNVSRRHLTPSQKAICIAKLTANTVGWKSKPGPTPKGEIAATAAISAEQAANKVGVSKDIVERAASILRQSPKKANEVEAGTKSVRRAAKEIREEKAAGGTIHDCLGYPVPKPALLYWNRSDEVKEVLKQISKLKSWAEDLQERKDPLYCEVNLNWLRVEFGNIYQSIKGALPFAVCTSCQGQLPDGCTLCKGRGVISEFRWENALPEEARVMRLIATKRNNK